MVDFMSLYPDAVYVGHNLINFDVPILERLWNVHFSHNNVLDTLVLSRLASPDRSGGHSLRNWGNTLGFPKGDHDDWTQLSPEMLTYCEQDVAVTEAVYAKVMEELEGFSEECQELEHKVAWIITEQERNGWLLDEIKASLLIGKYKERMNEIEQELQTVFPPIITERYSEKTGKRLKDKVEVFNPGSRQQVASRLEAKGAVWKDKTETGRAVVDERTLKDNEHIPEASLVLEYMTIQKRRSQVDSWLKHVGDDGRVHGRVITNGAVTGRMTHQSPNMAQVTAEEGPRSCWVVPEGKKLVGFDASGLELRMLAHYMNDPDYTKEVLYGDIHTANQMAAGLDSRNQAKTFIYAFLYGAGDSKIGSIAGGGAKAGAKLKQRFLQNTPALADLRERVGRASKRGYLTGLDGRRVYVRSEHAALNTLLQSAGAIVMKQTLVKLVEFADKWKLDYKLVGNIHDEVQAEVAEKHADQFGYLGVECIKAAGLSFDLRCPLDGEYKVGTNWSETH